MILAEKIALLRKKNGWSQDELAEKMNVSRQSVSKWESAASIPDINKIIEMGNIFGVTTDYLLKDDIESCEFTQEDSTPDGDEQKTIKVSLETANAFVAAKKQNGKRIGLYTMLCIMSPVMLLLLSAEASYKVIGLGITENVACAIGLAVLFLMVAGAVAGFILAGNAMRPYKGYAHANIETEYGVSGILKAQAQKFEGGYTTRIVTAVILCIISALPLIIVSILTASDFWSVFCVCVILVMVSFAVRLFITTGEEKAAYDLLLGKGEYAAERKEGNKRVETFSAIYWPCIVAGYLLWSFLSNDWKITWVVWPVAGLLYAALEAVIKATDKSNNK